MFVTETNTKVINQWLFECCECEGNPFHSKLTNSHFFHGTRWHPTPASVWGMYLLNVQVHNLVIYEMLKTLYRSQKLQLLSI